MKSGDPLFHNRGIERVPGPCDGVFGSPPIPVRQDSRYCPFEPAVYAVHVSEPQPKRASPVACRRLQKYDGMKAFYSDVLYSREYIYQKFNGAVYDQLKSKYDPNGVLPQPQTSAL